MITDASTQLPAQPLTRREQRELERAAEREAQIAKLRGVQSVEPVEAVTEPAAQAEPVFMSRRERREAERAAQELELAKLQRESAAAARSAIASNPELFAEQSAPEAQSLVSEYSSEQVVETLDPNAEPVELAPVVSLDEVRAAREETEDLDTSAIQIVEEPVAAVEIAPTNEPEIPGTFLRASAPVQDAARLLRNRGRGRVAGRFGGSMVAMSLLAGTVALGAGSAAAISAMGADDSEADSDAAVAAEAQTFTVDGSADVATDAAEARGEDTTAVTSIGTAAAANLATGVKLPDKATYTNDITSNVQYPFPMGVQITDPYGYRGDAPAGASSYHGGVDFTPGEGTPIGSMADGIVTVVDMTNSSSFGNYIEVQHTINGARVTTLYAHLQDGSAAVAVGNVVHVGDQLGKVGNTGISTGPHLHMEVHIGDEYVDPMYFLKKFNVPGVSVSVPTSIGPNVGMGVENKKLSHEESTARVDALFNAK